MGLRNSDTWKMRDEIQSGFVGSCNLQRESQGRDSSGPLRHPEGVALTLSIEIADVLGVWLHAEH